MKSLACKIIKTFNKPFEWLTPVGDLIIRLWVARVFFLAGLTKIQTWSSTVALFTYEYNAPLLSPKWAAMLGTGIELVMPVLLVIGLLGRLPAFVLFVFNIVAVFSYPYLLTEAGAIGFNDHFYWGMLLMVTMLHGPGKLSVDYLLKKLFTRKS